jgi:hypothetical protein
MKKLSTSLFLTFAVVAATSVGCGSSPGGGGGGKKLVPSDTGFFDGSVAGILGAWYSYGDWYNPAPGAGDCGTMNMGMFTEAQCSHISSPIPGDPFTNAGDGKMCTTGTAAKVIMDATGATAYSAIWGAGIGFDLNNGGTDDGGTGAKLAWDATSNGVTGFRFTIDMPPIGGQMRVEFPTNAAPGVTDINSAYWGGETMNLSPFTKAGTYSFHWADVGGPMYLTPHMAFDKTKIVSMQFHVVTNTSSAIDFNYCIRDLFALTD